MNETGSKANTWTHDFLNQMRLVGDPEADQVINKLIEDKGIAAARELFHRLIDQIELPVEELPGDLQNFIYRNYELKGVSEEQVKVAHDLFVDHGPKFLLILYFKSLPVLYSCANGARVLVKTGRLTSDRKSLDIFSRRIAETGQFLIFTMSEGSLKKGAIGIQSILKVRLMHAAIRAFVRQADWDSQELGEPINQEDMAITLLTFSLSLVEALGQFGINEKQEKLESYFSTWRAIGRLLGLEENLLPENLQEAKLLYTIILNRQSKSSEAGKLLTKSLLTFSREALRSEYLDNIPQLFIRFLAGDQVASNLGVARSENWVTRIFYFVMRKVFKYVEHLEDTDESIQEISDRVAAKLVVYMVKYFDEYRKKPLVLPPSLANKWNVSTTE